MNEQSGSDGRTALTDRILPWGIARRDLAGAVGDPASVTGWFDQLQALGAGTLLLGSPTEVSPTLDPGALREAGVEAQRRGIRLESGIGGLHPDRFDPTERDGLAEACRSLGVVACHTSFGTVVDRAGDPAMRASRLAAGADRLAWLADRAGLPLVVLSHEDLTSWELLRLIDGAARDNISIAFSPVDLVCRTEDPWLAYRRLADRVSEVFLSDAWIVRTDAGLGRRLCPIGEGCVPWTKILAEVTATTTVIVDSPNAQFDMPVFDPDWFADQPDVTAAELARLFAVARDEVDQVAAPTRSAAAKRAMP